MGKIQVRKEAQNLMELPTDCPVVARVLLNTAHGVVIEPLVRCCSTRPIHNDYPVPCCPDCQTLSKTAIKMRSQEILYKGACWYMNVVMCAGCDKIYYIPLNVREPRPSDNYRSVEHDEFI